MSPLVPGGCSNLRLAKAMPPFGQYLCAWTRRKADESISAPKRARITDPQAFPLQTGRFLGATTGATMPITVPLWPPFAASLAVLVGESHAPVVAVLLASWKKASCSAT
jgi:hypothetical protein